MDTGGYLPQSHFVRGVLVGLVIGCGSFVTLAAVFPQESVEFVGNNVTPPPETAPVVENVADAAPVELVPTVIPDEAVPVQPETVVVEEVTPETTPAVVEPEVATQITAPEISAPSLGAPSSGDTESGSGFTFANTADTVAPSLPTVSQPTTLESSDQGGTAVTNTQSVSAPSGNFDEVASTIVAPDSADQAQQVPLPQTPSAFETFSQPFVHDGSKPLLSLILLVGNMDQLQAVVNLGVPVTVAVDSTNPEAGNLIEAYTNAQGEVLLYLASDGVHGVRAGDGDDVVAGKLALAMQNSLGAIGVMDAPGGSLGADESTVISLLMELEATGMAVVSATGEDGVNHVQTLSDDIGRPVASISRKIDNGDGKISIIREMDKAILETETAADVTVYGEASGDTISALGFWLRSQKAQLVTMAPVSAVMNH